MNRVIERGFTGNKAVIEMHQGIDCIYDDSTMFKIQIF